MQNWSITIMPGKGVKLKIVIFTFWLHLCISLTAALTNMKVGRERKLSDPMNYATPIVAKPPTPSHRRSLMEPGPLGPPTTSNTWCEIPARRLPSERYAVEVRVPEFDDRTLIVIQNRHYSKYACLYTRVYCLPSHQQHRACFLSAYMLLRCCRPSER